MTSAVKAAGFDFQVLDLVEPNTESPEQDVTMPRRIADSVKVLRPATGVITQVNRDIELGPGCGAGLGGYSRTTPHLIDKTLRELGDGDYKNLLLD